MNKICIIGLLAFLESVQMKGKKLLGQPQNEYPLNNMAGMLYNCFKRMEG